jgi:hypothetical protein
MSSPRSAVLISVLAIAFCAWSAPAHADRRSFAQTYEYVTMPRGGLELEFYNTQTRPSFDDDAQELVWQIEIEYGITDHWDISLYQAFSQASGNTDPALDSAFRYSETKLRTRYRFGERGAWPVDVLGYFEIKFPFGEDALALEPKLILARDFGKLTAAVNLIAEIEREDGETELIPEWAAGVTYELSPSFKVGAETFGELAPEGDERELEAWAGPSVSWAPSPKIWITANAGFGLTEESPDLIARAIIGIGL